MSPADIFEYGAAIAFALMLVGAVVLLLRIIRSVGGR